MINSFIYYFQNAWKITFDFCCNRAREYVDCIGHIRLLSWLLLGSLTHTAMFAGTSNPHIHGPPIPVAQPIPQEVSCHVADHVQVIISGFPEQSKTSVLHMSSLYHAFILCQVRIFPFSSMYFSVFHIFSIFLKIFHAFFSEVFF